MERLYAVRTDGTSGNLRGPARFAAPSSFAAFLFRASAQIERMKFLPKFALALVASLSLTAAAVAQDAATQLLTEAQAAYLRGDLDSAKAKFESVVRLDPKNRTAIGYLQQIRAKQTTGSGGTERALAAVVLPSVQFKDAELSAVLDALRQQLAKASGGKQAVNFVVQLPAEQAKTPITLSLSSVPFTEVLKYIGALANVTFTYDKYAIMVRPATAAQAEPKPAEA